MKLSKTRSISARDSHAQTCHKYLERISLPDTIVSVKSVSSFKRKLHKLAFSMPEPAICR